MAKFYTLGPLRQQEYEVIVHALRTVSEQLQGTAFSQDERRVARSALRNLDPRIVVREVVQGEVERS